MFASKPLDTLPLRAYALHMDHIEALDLMLAHACQESVEYSHALGADVITFTLTAHCTKYTVEAILVSTFKTIQYKIVNVTVEDY